MIIGPNQNANYSGFQRAQTQKFPHQVNQPIPYGIHQNFQPLPSSTCGLCQKTFNLELNLPKILPCGHTYCLFCLTLQENQTMPSIQIECISCCIKYQHVPASHYETNIEIVKVLEKLSQTLPIQMPQQMMYQQTSNVGQQQFYGTPTRMTQSHLPGNSYDISQVQQIFEGMRIEAINNSPQTLTKTHSANKSFNQIKDFSHLNVSPQNKSPIRQHLQICTRKGCKNPRAVLENGRIQANYCSKQCDDIDQNKPAFTKNQDEIYRQATRQNGRERSKTPTKHQNYQQSNNYSPLRGNRSKSPNQNRTAYNPLKKQSVFSSDESGFDSDNYRTPQIIRQQTIPFQDYHGQQNDSMIRQLSFDQNSARQSLNQVQLQNSIGTFGDSAFEKFVASQKKDMNHSTNNSSLFDTPSTTTYSQYGSNNNMPFNYGNRSAPPKTTIHQQYAQHLGQDNVIQDAKLDIYLAPTDPSKCINHQCRNRKFNKIKIQNYNHFTINQKLYLQNSFSMGCSFQFAAENVQIS